ncbi:tetratricopeptide repeat protein [Streptococcus moroccensis]|uniref:Tetratricopeptide (TPR) repeat protein n=1 Tax=Streptococcus moroccensis TaxID=1451356 RepID=A0ABT9YS16_9STRE|nr:tetratricopeptide repeat protein [Streptococcus moroccensis]MDQ0222514.1 tetratricopeptide (TPR) repeat protein [Streptococcus moroccensis]
MESQSKLVVEALEAQDLEKVEYHLRQALVEDDEETLLDLGAYFESIGFLPQAEVIYQQLLLNYPELAINLARIAIEDGAVEQAFSYLDQIEPSSPYYLEALVTKADFYQLEGLADVAKEKLLEASQLTDDDLIRFGLAEIELELEDYQSAINYYASVDNRSIFEQTGVSTYQRIGYAYANLGKFEAAIEFLEKAVELEYHDDTLYELATLLVETEQYQRANLYFKQLATLNPEFEGYQYPYAQSLHAEHQTKEALTVLQDYLSKNETAVSVLLLASQYAYELKDPDLSEQYLLKAKVWADDVEEIDLRLSTLYLEQERYEDLLDLAEDSIDHVLTRWHLAKTYRALDKPETESAYRQLVTDLQDNPEFLKEFIFVLREIGEFKEANQQLNYYLQLVPDDLEMAALADD